MMAIWSAASKATAFASRIFCGHFSLPSVVSTLRHFNRVVNGRYSPYKEMELPVFLYIKTQAPLVHPARQDRAAVK